MTDEAATLRRHKRQELFQEKVLRKLDHLERRMSQLMTNVTEVTEAVETLASDLETLASTAKAEFEKLETELSEGKTEVDLEPLKNSIEALDAKAKSAASEIPSN
jgi:predicted  nucleic acid-binding Zn-ribbon protein